MDGRADPATDNGIGEVGAPQIEEPRGATPTARRAAYRVDADVRGWAEEEVAAEYPLTILVNGREMATVVCSPTHLEELVLGFLTAEGVLRRDERIEELYVIREEGIAVVTAPEREGALEQEMFGKRYVGSCCGKSRTGFYFFNDARTARPVEGAMTLTLEDCFAAMDRLQAASPLFARTGGVHNAALGSADGLDAVRTDIGRHNTLDKLYGWALREGVPLAERVVVFSGRISSEVLLKVAKMGCPVLLSKSAPTDLALSMADELGITTAGFLRKDRVNVYTHAERIAGVEPVSACGRSPRCAP